MNLGAETLPNLLSLYLYYLNYQLTCLQLPCFMCTPLSANTIRGKDWSSLIRTMCFSNVLVSKAWTLITVQGSVWNIQNNCGWSLHDIFLKSFHHIWYFVNEICIKQLRKYRRESILTRLYVSIKHVVKLSNFFSKKRKEKIRKKKKLTKLIRNIFA